MTLGRPVKRGRTIRAEELDEIRARSGLADKTAGYTRNRDGRAGIIGPKAKRTAATFLTVCAVTLHNTVRRPIAMGL